MFAHFRNGQHVRSCGDLQRQSSSNVKGKGQSQEIDRTPAKTQLREAAELFEVENCEHSKLKDLKEYVLHVGSILSEWKAGRRTRKSMVQNAHIRFKIHYRDPFSCQPESTAGTRARATSGVVLYKSVVIMAVPESQCDQQWYPKAVQSKASSKLQCV